MFFTDSNGLLKEKPGKVGYTPKSQISSLPIRTITIIASSWDNKNKMHKEQILVHYQLIKYPFAPLLEVSKIWDERRITK